MYFSIRNNPSLNALVYTLCTGLSLFANADAPTHANSYSELCPLAVASLSTAIPDEKNTKPTDSLPLSERQKHEVVYKLLATLKESQPVTTQSTVMKRIFHDLNVFYMKSDKPENNSQHLFSKINRTQTLFGQAALAHTLAHPTTNTQLLIARQKAIQTLLQNEETTQALARNLTQMQTAETSFLANLTPLDPVTKSFYAKFLFPNFLKRFNTQPAALNLKSYGWEKAGIPTLTALLGAVQGSIALRGSTDMTRPTTSISDRLALEVLRAANGIGSLIPATWQSPVVFAANIIPAVIPVLTTMNNTNYQELCLQEKLCAAASILDAFKKTQTMINAHPELQAIISPHTLENHSKNFKKLIRLLEDPTFNNNKGAWFASGQIRAAYYLMQKTHNEFAPIARYLGEVDALLSTSKLMKEHDNQRVGYSFAKYVQQDTPLIAIDGSWNPMIDKAIVVPNSITLGKDGKTRIALVTGSNTGGKSTVMINGLTTGVWFAQTLAITPAKECTLTPFDHIETSVGVQSDTSMNLSHLHAEVERGSSIITSVEKQPASAKSLVATDELFEGASGSDGEECVYKMGKRLASSPNTLGVMVTQFQGKPTQLERDTDGICKNFNVDVIKHADGTIERPHKVEAGVSKVGGIAQLLFDKALAEKTGTLRHVG